MEFQVATRSKETPQARARRAHNLTLTDEAATRGERYAERAGVSLSRLVEKLLLALPAGESTDEPELSPTVAHLRRLLAHADKPVDWRGEYRKHLEKKHAAERKH